MGFEIDSLIPQERTGVEEPRYLLRRGETTTGLEDLRGLLAAIRAAGEKGLQVTRFKGLGEMNAEELRETTLDPANRTLLQVTHGGRRRRRRPVPRPDGRQSRTPPRVHREARAGGEKLGRVAYLQSTVVPQTIFLTPFHCAASIFAFGKIVMPGYFADMAVMLGV